MSFKIGKKPQQVQQMQTQQQLLQDKHAKSTRNSEKKTGQPPRDLREVPEMAPKDVKMIKAKKPLHNNSNAKIQHEKAKEDTEQKGGSGEHVFREHYLKKLAYKSKVLRIRAAALKSLQTLAETHMHTLVDKLLVKMSTNTDKRITFQYVLDSLNLANIAVSDIPVKPCPNFKPTVDPNENYPVKYVDEDMIVHSDDEMDSDSEALPPPASNDIKIIKNSRNGANGKQKQKSGAILKQKVAFYSKQTGCFILSKYAFKDKMKLLFAEKAPDQIRFSKDALMLLQYLVEKYITETITKARVLSEHRKSKVLEVEDFTLIARFL